MNNSSSSSKPSDWREWFRSSDYDDPWSHYYPFQQQQQESIAVNNNNNNGDYQKGIISSVLNGTWERRRHGMNLEQLNMSFRGVDIEQYHRMKKKMEDGDASSENDQGNGQNATQQEEEEEEEMIKAQEKMNRMNAQTRFTCRMLDDLYRTGIWRETDRPRTERCHRAIARLLTMTPENPPTMNDAQPDISITGLAQRAGAILQRMEQCSPLALVHNRQSKIMTTSSTHLSEENDVDENKEASNADTTLLHNASYQEVYSNYPQHLSYTKFALPTPTRAIYNMVLLSYGKEAGAMHIAQQAEDVVWSMIVRGLQKMQQQSQQARPPQCDDDFAGRKEKIIADDTKNEMIFPSIENWNSVLKCWSRSTDADRAFHSYSFLLSWLEWSNQCQDDDREVGNKGNMGVSPNVDSFHLALQSCLVDVSSDKDEMTHQSKDAIEFQQRAKEMGSGVAIRLWKEMQNVEITIDSTTYFQMLQAICQTSELPSASSSTRALAALARVFTKCCQDDMVTPEILVLVRAATTESQFTQLKAKVGDNINNK